MVVGIAGLLLGSMLPIPGNIEVKIVKSGSMEPTIPTGSLIVVKPAASYAVGDIVTFGPDTKADIPTTHRIVEVQEESGQRLFITKGDANEEQDPQPVRGSEIIGAVKFSAPYVGYVIAFAREPLGFALLVVVPAALVILEEVIVIYKEARKMWRRRRDDEDAESGDASSGSETLGQPQVQTVYVRRRVMDEIFVPMIEEVQAGWQAQRAERAKRNDGFGVAAATLSLVFISSALVGTAGHTVSYFSDIERSLGNIMRAGVWQDPEEVEALVIEETDKSEARGLKAARAGAAAASEDETPDERTDTNTEETESTDEPEEGGNEGEHGEGSGQMAPIDPTDPEEAPAVPEEEPLAPMAPNEPSDETEGAGQMPSNDPQEGGETPPAPEEPVSTPEPEPAATPSPEPAPEQAPVPAPEPAPAE